jgi:protein-tyrosine-phosphatase
LLVVDGSDVCRAPIVAFTLRGRLGAGLAGHAIVSRGLTAESDRTMCDSASTRLGFTGPAIAFYGAHRATPLSIADIASADLILTAERAQRSAVVRMLPGTQATVFTWKEALVLASVLVDRRRMGALSAPADLAALARALHGARGTVPLIEPPVRTGVFHRRRPADTDPLTIESGHGGSGEHRRVTQESADVAAALGTRLAVLMHETVPEASLPESVPRARRVRRGV